MKQIYANPDLCTGCKLCSTACSITKLGVATPHKGAIIIKQNLFECYEFQALCRQCNPAPCIDACMMGCIQRDAATGVVTLEAERCVGCWMCVMVCPYDAIRRDRERQEAVKCDQCYQRSGGPACVAICPTEAILEVEGQ